MTTALTIPKVERCFSSSIQVTAGGVRLPDIPALGVLLANWNVLNEPTFALKAGSGSDLVTDDLNEVYWGFNGVYAHQLFVSQSTPILPVANLKDVCLRSRPGQTVTIWFSYWQ